MEKERQLITTIVILSAASGGQPGRGGTVVKKLLVGGGALFWTSGEYSPPFPSPLTHLWSQSFFDNFHPHFYDVFQDRVHESVEVPGEWVRDHTVLSEQLCGGSVLALLKENPEGIEYFYLTFVEEIGKPGTRAAAHLAMGAVMRSGGLLCRIWAASTSRTAGSNRCYKLFLN